MPPGAGLYTGGHPAKQKDKSGRKLRRQEFADPAVFSWNFCEKRQAKECLSCGVLIRRKGVGRCVKQQDLEF